MDLKSGYPFWAVKNGLMHSFSQLKQDIRCDVAVVGGGITGALIADELSRHGHEVVVIEQRDIGWGSTSASTALLQYEIDTHMVDLAARYGEESAALAYQSCVGALDIVRTVAARVRGVDFHRMKSLYLASQRRDVRVLEQELALRKKYGIRVRWLSTDELKARFSLHSPGAILSADAARIDPYRMVYRLLWALSHAGASVFDRTSIKSLQPTSAGVTLTTDQDCKIRARHVVLAAGYATQGWLKSRVSKNHSSYAFITDPISDAVLGPLKHTMVWESARPYLYMRATGEGRLIVGGEDDPVDLPAVRDRRVDKKAATLQRKVEKMLPHLPMTPAFAWAGTFAETADGLPFFGRHAQYGARVHFAMAYGGNGIIYSALGAGLIRAAVERRKHPLAALFSFERLRH